MTNLSWNEIQDRATEFAAKWHGETYEKGESQSFWSDFLHIFGIDRRRHGAYFEYAIKKGNGAQGFIDMFWPGKLLAEQKSGGRDLSKANIQAFEYLETMPDHDLPEAIVVSDFTTFQFIQLETNARIEFKLEDLPKHVKLFGFLMGQTSKNIAEQDPVNRDAAEAMARLHNQLADDNYKGHELELLLMRIVFCLFADDSGIFDRRSFQDFIEYRTSEDGSDLGIRLMQVFQTLDTPYDRRQKSLDEALVALPYVNGGLFRESIDAPQFTAKMRRDLLSAMELDWSKVSPAIFGSMFQGVMDETQRRNLGAHYTSEVNILRVIKPLFLDDLYDEFAKALRAGPRKKFDELRKLQDKLAGLKFLDPACGSGNFLVITYRELRKLEHKIVAALSKNADQIDMLASAGEGTGTLKVNVDQMYGIEIEEFPSLIATTALWLTDHQMNMEYSRESGKMFKRLPLTHSATIVNDNALTRDWAEVVSPHELDYILGNPPFVGKKEQSKEQKQLVVQTFNDAHGSGILDFVTAWYAKSTSIMKQNPRIQTALVSTNSIIQGEQVPVLWKYLFEQGIVINFLHQTFKWSNDAKGNAAVYCTIVGFALQPRSHKTLYEYTDIKGEPIETTAQNINGYGINAPSIFITSRSKPLNTETPPMNYGSMPIDGGTLILDETEYQGLLADEPNTKELVREYVGGNEFLNNKKRYCLWLENANPTTIKQSRFVLDRIAQNRAYRASSSRPQTLEAAQTPALFGEIRQPSTNYLLLPKVSSENRHYMPIGFMPPEIIANGSSLIIPNATLYHFGILQSSIHMAWMRTVAGRLESRYQYSAGIVYNNFIWPEVTEPQRAEISRLAQNILDARAQFPDSSLADLYDPLTMPPILAKAHRTLDRAVDRLYRREPFATDADRVAMLFEKYQETS